MYIKLMYLMYINTLFVCNLLLAFKFYNYESTLAMQCDSPLIYCLTNCYVQQGLYVAVSTEICPHRAYSTVKSID